MSTELVQGTPEWHEARVGKITGSMIGAVLGVSPFQSRARAVRTMVEEAMGRRTFFENDAMRWGKDHEDEAARLYKALYAGDMSVEETGFWESGDLGASPDRLVGDHGLLEVKCPWAIREDIAPEFKPIAAQPHYYHQMQMQLLCTDRQWCDFLQWTPHDHKLERVERDPNWLLDNTDEIISFMEEFEALRAQVSEGGPAERLAISEGFARAIEVYRDAEEKAAIANAALKEAKDAVTSLMETNKLEVCEAEFAKVQLVKRKGSVKWKEVAEELLPDKGKLDAISNKHIGRGSQSWKITLGGDK